MIISAHRERFRAKWIPVRVKKTRQNKRLEPDSDSIRIDKALADFDGAAGGTDSLAARWHNLMDFDIHRRSLDM
jgi:hypothetical protein